MPELPVDRLCDQDAKFWTPLPFVIDYVLRQIPEGGRVLEVGPGMNWFARADVAVDQLGPLNGLKADFIKHDCAKHPLPFADKSFDFVYCRHVLEDMYNPFLICAEMNRVAKAGYIETPSPIAEYCRGIDVRSPTWRGYNHHRFIIWPENGELCFLSKFGCFEYVPGGEDWVVSRLRGSPKYWNTHYLWTGELKVRHLLDEPAEFLMPDEYPQAICNAINRGAAAIDNFYQRMQGA